jgi:hypothetical protein
VRIGRWCRGSRISAPLRHSPIARRYLYGRMRALRVRWRGALTAALLGDERAQWCCAALPDEEQLALERGERVTVSTAARSRAAARLASDTGAVSPAPCAVELQPRAVPGFAAREAPTASPTPKEHRHMNAAGHRAAGALLARELVRRSPRDLLEPALLSSSC